MTCIWTSNVLLQEGYLIAILKFFGKCTTINRRVNLLH